MGARAASLAPAIGALAISVWLAHHQIERRVGHVLFIAVAAFGAAAVAFALSTSIVISILALAVYGAGDAVSVVIRLRWCSRGPRMRCSAASSR